MAEEVKAVEVASTQPPHDPWLSAKRMSTYCCAIVGCTEPGIFLLHINQAVQPIALCQDHRSKAIVEEKDGKVTIKSITWDLGNGCLKYGNHANAIPHTMTQAIDVLKKRYSLEKA